MKQLPKARLSRVLILAAVIVLLAASLAGCNGDGNGTVNNLPSSTEGTDAASSNSEPSEAETEPEEIWGTVNTDRLNVRAEADRNSTSVTKLAINTRVKILETKTVENVTWGRLDTGWVDMTYITLDGQETPETTEATEPATTTEPETTEATEATKETTSTASVTGTVTADELRIRKGAGTTYDTVGSYKKGDTITILETSGNWGRTDKGWVSLSYVQTTTTNTGTNTGTVTGTDSTVVSDGNTTVKGYGVVTLSSLNVRTGPGTKYKQVSTVSGGQRLPYYQTSGNWARTDQGWVSLTYFNTAALSSGTKGTVNYTTLNIRKSASSSSDKLGTYSKGDKVEILETSGNWGRTEKGWISLNYVTIDVSTLGTDTGTSTNITANTKCTVTASTLRIRKTASASADVVGTYSKGDTITILEVSGNWGRTEKGWVSLSYVEAVGTDTSTLVTDGNTTVKGYGVVTYSTLNVRKGPGQSYDKVTTVKLGERYAYYQESGNWVRTEKGWVSKTYFYIEGTTGSTAVSGTVNADNSPVYEGPATTFTVKATLNSGVKVQVLNRVTISGKEWGYTTTGWICMDYVKMD